MDDKQKEWLAWSVLGVVLLAAIASDGSVCRETYSKYGLVAPTCHDGAIRQTATMAVTNLRRGASGSVSLTALAHYTTGGVDEVQQATVPELSSIALTLVDGKGKATPIKPTNAWSSDGGATSAVLALPVELPDGDYQLHADYETRIAKGSLDVPLPLYTPARIHVITDRPLYEPGNTIKFRAVVLRARDLAPLDGRPGAWIVKDPDGTILLEEKSAATEWGVVAGSFPVDRGAPTGAWTIAWKSGEVIDEVHVDVKPFTLPRFRVEATASKSYYRAGETPEIKGAVLYSSGAPVANAAVELAWNIAGEWPPPTEWTETVLPKTAKTAANGRFELVLPKIPQDLVGRVTMTAHLAAVDPAGDRVEGNVSVLLSQDGIQVSAVTELENGLVQGFNNRMYLRVTTPDGRVLSGAKVKVQRAWEATDQGEVTTLDEDGVASLQLDPGAPVNITVPPLPYRPSPREATVTRGEVEELIAGEGAPLGDQVEMDRWLPALEPCAKHVAEQGEIRVGLRVDRGGGVMAAIAGQDPLEQCAARVLRGKRLPAGSDRMYTVPLSFTDPPLPSVSASVETTLDEPEGLGEKIQEKARAARDCLPRGDELYGQLPQALVWRGMANQKVVELAGWIVDTTVDAETTTGRALACVQQRVAGRIDLAEPLASDALGIVRFTLEQPVTPGEERPQATTMIGYELLVTAELPDSPATKLRLTPGTIPPLRLRVAPVLAKVGETVTAELIRGPEFRGELPNKLVVEHLHGKKEVDVDAEHHAKLTIDPGTQGWVEIRGGGQRALVYVRPDAELAVAMKARQATYRPGDRAELDITTLIGGKGGSAAVGLIGVDESLGQLVPLPGPDDMGRVRPQVQTSSPAFGTLDGQALVLGRIRGANAAAATVIRVSAIPPPPELDAVISARASSVFDPNAETTDAFYIVLAELHQQARMWETTAPAGEKMRPPQMAKLWTAAIEAVVARGETATDAYGRRLALRRLPDDLLALVDPRNVIVVGTRLPEDIENWTAWVRKEKP